MNTAGLLDITIDWGANFLLPFTLYGDDGLPLSIALSTITGKIRLTPTSDVVATFTGTVMDGPNGEGQLALTAVETAAIPLDTSEVGDRVLTQYMWDCEVTFSDGFVQRILQGSAFVSPGIDYV